MWSKTIMRKFFIVGALALVCGTAAIPSVAADNGDNVLGQSETPATVDRIIVIGPGTAHVNVDRGDSVRFVVGNRSFAWRFSVPTTISEIDLNDIAPPCMLDHVVKAYIKRIPIYDGG